ncbi:hypothetical protein VTN77DRAFT_5742 [Rasamsonia byssochlamydoides]|uniref:uncharacterized protein n=1 Tax=Rasamsonia byssochlamydoides TaxID=89139 RepID=UPI003743F739
MVSLWPWKGEDNSPASFEKALSSLSTKITQTANRLDANRQQARRFKALWTLYTTFAYLLYSIILALVLGWKNWGIIEYAAVLGGPVVIYAVREASSKYFEYRISKTQQQLDELNKQREETIEKLKIATKYNSTQQLLEKYGGETPKTTKNGGGSKRRETGGKDGTPQVVERTGIPPPPTANIRRPPNEASPLTPAQSPPGSVPVPQPPSYFEQNQFPGPPVPPPIDEPGFAPNAFPAVPQYSESPRWYDRLLDVLLGEDETLPRNRLALICQDCRLVNGQAPPGVKTLEELGRWRCGSCGAWNGVESEAKKVLADIKRQSQSADSTWESVSKKGEEDVSSNGEVTDDGVIVGSETKDSEGEEEASEPEPEQSARRSKRG